MFAAFDAIARQRRVFKVETVGDCYVAVSGLPNPCRDHALVMARFARDCLNKFQEQTKLLELTLGPDVGDLKLRVGLHSGPVTAGVLRGERSRFQLFGDTMNTASRMESTGIPGKIHLSHETANRLVAAGKANWVVPRDDLVVAKGKGELKTFWLDVVNSRKAKISSDEDTESDDSSIQGLHTTDGTGADTRALGKEFRLIQWTTEVLLSLLGEIEGHRGECDNKLAPLEEHETGSPHEFATTVLEEVQEVIDLPAYNSQQIAEAKEVELGHEVVSQVFRYVRV
jgi:Adenylate and Guanylate cyclase catalytic domain